MPGRAGRVRAARHRGGGADRRRLRRRASEGRCRDGDGEEAVDHPVAAGRSGDRRRGLHAGARRRREAGLRRQFSGRLLSMARTMSRSCRTISSDGQQGRRSPWRRRWGRKGRLGYIFHDADFYVTNQRDGAFKATIEADYPDMQIVAEAGMADPSRSEEIATAMLTQHPDLDGIYVTWAEPALSVLAALKAAGNSHTKIVTLDLNEPAALDMVIGRERRGAGRRRGLRHRPDRRARCRREPDRQGRRAFPRGGLARGDQGQDRRKAGCSRCNECRRPRQRARRGEIASRRRRPTDVQPIASAAVARDDSTCSSTSSISASSRSSCSSPWRSGQRVSDAAQPVQHRAADGAGDGDGDRPRLRAVGRRDRPFDRLDRRRGGACRPRWR